VYTTYEADKRRLVNYTHARSLASPSRGRGRGRGAARRGAAGQAVRVRVRCDEIRTFLLLNTDNKTLTITGE